MKKIDLENQPSSTREQDKQFALELLEEFLVQYPTELACLEELYRLAGIEQKCSNCQGLDLDVSTNGRSGICIRCHKKTWFTAGTFLDHIKKPIPRLAAIKLMAGGAVLTSTLFSTLVNLSQGSAHGVLQWVRFAIQDYLLQDPVEVHSRHFLSVFCKRSSETPAREHPVAEQDAMEEDESPSSGLITRHAPFGEHFETQLKENCTTELSSGCPTEIEEQKQYSGANEERILQFISDEPVGFDSLHDRVLGEVGELNASLTVLEIDGKVKRLPGDYYILSKNKPKISLPKEETMLSIGTFLDFIKVHFAGISRKYLQSYIAAYWCYVATTGMSDQLLFKTCLSRLRATNNKTRTVVTPLWVNYCC